MRTTLAQDETNIPYIGRNIMSLAGENAGLLPDGMTAELAGRFLTLSLKGRPITTFERKEHLEISDVTRDLPNVIYHQRISADLYLDVQTLNEEDHRLHLFRDWETICELELAISGSTTVLGEMTRLGSLEPEDLPALYNFLESQLTNGAAVVGGATLIDGIKHHDGSEDPRLMQLLARLDAEIEAPLVEAQQHRLEQAKADADVRREAANERSLREDHEQMQIQDAVDDFFRCEF